MILIGYTICTTGCNWLDLDMKEENEALPVLLAIVGCGEEQKTWTCTCRLV